MRKNRRNPLRNRPSYRLETLETRVMLAADWQNPVERYDVDAADTAVTISPLDALLVVNELNDRIVSDPQTGILPQLGDDAITRPPYFDVNADGYVSPIDAILVINELAWGGVQETDGFTTVMAPAHEIAGTPTALLHDGPDNDSLVNTTTDRQQRDSDVAADSTGNIVMVWQSFGQDGSSWGIYGQRYSPDGAKVGDEFRVNTRTQGAQRSPAVSASDDGFMVVWQSLGQDGSSWGVYGQRYDVNGNRIGDEIQINETARGGQLNPDVAANGSGVYSVAWQGRGLGDRSGIFIRELNDEGFLSGEMRVNNFTSGNQQRPSIAVEDGSWAVAWQGRGADDPSGVFFTTSDLQQDIRANLRTSGVQRRPAITSTHDGVAVSWQSGGDVYLRHFSESDGTTNGATDEVHVNQTSRGVQRGPAIDELADGSLIVSWFGRGRGDRLGVFSRMFDEGLSATSDETLVNITTRAGQIRPSVAAVNNGYLATWQGRGPGDRYGIFTRFFDTEMEGPFAIDPIDDQTVDEGETVMVDVKIIELVETVDVVFGIEVAPLGASIDAVTGLFTWPTSEPDGPGVYDVTVSATSNDASADPFKATESFQIFVNEVNLPPVLDPIADQTALVDSPFSLTVTATDPDLPPQPLTFTSSLVGGDPLPDWLTFSSDTQTFSGIPAESDAGVLDVQVIVTDSIGDSDSQSFTITVTSNQPPVVDPPIPDQTAFEDTPFSLDITGFFSDPDEDDLTFSTSALPNWLGFTDGVFMGTPTIIDIGTISITVTASDGLDSVDDTFDLTVVDINNDPPSILDQVFRVDSMAGDGTVVGTVVASDPDPSDTLAFSILGGNDDGIYAIDSSTGQLTVADSTTLPDTPQTDLIVQVSDGTFESSATVTVYATMEELVVGYSLEARDSEGNSLMTVIPGQTIQLVLSVQDVRMAPTGVFSAFADIVYATEFVAMAGDVDFSVTYGSGTNAGVDVPGLIDEAGGVDGLSELGGDVYEVLSVPMTVLSAANGTTVFFATNATEDQIAHPTLPFGATMSLPAAQIDFGTLSLTVASNGDAAPVMAASSSSASTVAIPRDLDFSDLFADDAAESSEVLAPVGNSVSPMLNRDRDSQVRDAAFGNGRDDDSWWFEDTHEEGWIEL